jgi:hypothetical protein
VPAAVLVASMEERPQIHTRTGVRADEHLAGVRPERHQTLMAVVERRQDGGQPPAELQIPTQRVERRRRGTQALGPQIRMHLVAARHPHGMRAQKRPTRMPPLEEEEEDGAAQHRIQRADGEVRHQVEVGGVQMAAAQRRDILLSLQAGENPVLDLAGALQMVGYVHFLTCYKHAV